MQTIIIVIFVIGYVAIALEHSIKINKTASALLTGVLCWTLFILAEPTPAVVTSDSFRFFYTHLETVKGVENVTTLTDTELYKEFVIHSLAEHLSEIAQILFFLMGAMTIVELVDSHHGFRFITDRIKTRSATTLLWTVCTVAFFLSSILDNLTTTIVMVSLIRKLIPGRDLRLLFIGMIVISANAGGAWTPIGDVTTTMLWIGGQITSLNIIETLFIPSVICMVVPLAALSFSMKGKIGNEDENSRHSHHRVRGGKLMLALGVAALVSVPVFKTTTHLPPYVGMLLGLGFLWVVSEFIHPELEETDKKHFSVVGALTRIDVPSVLFFLGILMAVGALESMQVLHQFATQLDSSIGNHSIIISLIGILSSIVDNVPLVAASMGMYSMDVFPTDDFIWEYLAYCAGTGGSILIIGSAAGVAAMGMEKIDFIWYVKKISLLALLGYGAGAATYLILN